MTGIIKKKLRKFEIWIDQKRKIPKVYPFIMHNDEKVLFQKYIRNSKNYLEFGLGGSTIFTVLHSDANITSVDTNKEWINFMKGYRLIREESDKRLRVVFINIGETKSWGFPVDETDSKNFYKFSSEIFELTDASVYDLILVDGRFRVACALQSVLNCQNNKDLKILIHDYSFRDEYKIVEKYLDNIESVNSLYVFKVKDEIDENELKKDYEKYKNQSA
ncbi:MAG: hypothetical protein WBF83_08000 [Moheibacter sp.]